MSGRHQPRLLGTFIIGAAVSGLACGGAAPRTTTPSGGPCVDMPVVPAGEEPTRSFRRLAPVRSAATAATNAERLASLRAAACAVGADAVIEATQEEIQQPDKTYRPVAEGSAVVWDGPAPLPPEVARVPAGKLCVRGARSDGGVDVAIYPKACISSSTPRLEASCTIAAAEGSTMQITATFRYGAVAAGQSTLADCSGGGIATCATAPLTPGTHALRVDDLRREFEFPLPDAGNEEWCVGEPY